MCIIKDPDTGLRNVSFHRAQVLGPDQTGFLICPRQALRIFQMYGARGRPMEVAMVVGAHPLISFAGGCVAPYGVDEMTIAGGLLGDPVRMVKCETVDLEVPADAEMILEGEIIPGEMTEEGPFREVTGTYAQEGSTPLFRVKAVTHRRDAGQRRRSLLRSGDHTSALQSLTHLVWRPLPVIKYIETSRI